MRVSSLPKAATWKRTGRDSNPQSVWSRANALPSSHTGQLNVQSVYSYAVEYLLSLMNAWKPQLTLDACIRQLPSTVGWRQIGGRRSGRSPCLVENQLGRVGTFTRQRCNNEAGMVADRTSVVQMFVGDFSVQGQDCADCRWASPRYLQGGTPAAAESDTAVYPHLAGDALISRRYAARRTRLWNTWHHQSLADIETRNLAIVIRPLERWLRIKYDTILLALTVTILSSLRLCHTRGNTETK